MALKNSNENYLKIVFDNGNDTIIVNIFKSEESRRNGLGDFERFEERLINLPINLDIIPVQETENPKTIKQMIRTQSYLALKQLPEFEDWDDC